MTSHVEATHGYGIKLYRETDVTGTFELVGGVLDLTPPESSGDSEDATHHGSPGGVREKIAGLINPGQMTVDLVMDTTNTPQETLKADHYARENRKYKFEAPGNFGQEFMAWVITWAPVTPLEGKMTQSFTFEVSGKPTDPAFEGLTSTP